MYQLNIQKGKQEIGNYEFVLKLQTSLKNTWKTKGLHPFILKANSLKVTNTTNGWESTHNKCDFKASKPLTEPQQ